jgi:hypothetical protein
VASPDKVDSGNQGRGWSKTTAGETEELEETMGQTKTNGKIIEEKKKRPYINKGEECR